MIERLYFLDQPKYIKWTKALGVDRTEVVIGVIYIRKPGGTNEDYIITELHSFLL